MQSAAEKLCARFGTRDPFELCDRLNIRLSFDHLPAAVRGFYTQILDMDFIHINRLLDGNGRRAVCAHELGHALLHPGVNTVFLSRASYLNGDKLESQADLFAACLLIPDSAFQDEYGDALTMEQLSARLGVPERYLELKYRCIGNG